MSGIIWLSLALMLGGLGICFLSSGAKSVVLSALFWWVGIILAVIGFILLIAPFIVWIAGHLRQMIGAS